MPDWLWQAIVFVVACCAGVDFAGGWWVEGGICLVVAVALEGLSVRARGWS